MRHPRCGYQPEPRLELCEIGDSTSVQIWVEPCHEYCCRQRSAVARRLADPRVLERTRTSPRFEPGRAVRSEIGCRSRRRSVTRNGWPGNVRELDLLARGLLVDLGSASPSSASPRAPLDCSTETPKDDR